MAPKLAGMERKPSSLGGREVAPDAALTATQRDALASARRLLREPSRIHDAVAAFAAVAEDVESAPARGGGSGGGGLSLAAARVRRELGEAAAQAKRFDEATDAFRAAVVAFEAIGASTADAAEGFAALRGMCAALLQSARCDAQRAEGHSFEALVHLQRAVRAAEEGRGGCGSGGGAPRGPPAVLGPLMLLGQAAVNIQRYDIALSSFHRNAELKSAATPPLPADAAEKAVVQVEAKLAQAAARSPGALHALRQQWALCDVAIAEATTRHHIIVEAARGATGLAGMLAHATQQRDGRREGDRLEAFRSLLLTSRGAVRAKLLTEAETALRAAAAIAAEHPDAIPLEERRTVRGSQGYVLCMRAQSEEQRGTPEYRRLMSAAVPHYRAVIAMFEQPADGAAKKQLAPADELSCAATYTQLGIVACNLERHEAGLEYMRRARALKMRHGADTSAEDKHIHAVEKIVAKRDAAVMHEACAKVDARAATVSTSDCSLELAKQLVADGRAAIQRKHFADAEEALLHALAQFDRLAKHSSTATAEPEYRQALSSLGTCHYCSAQQHERGSPAFRFHNELALPHFSQALQVLRHTVGTDDPMSIPTLFNIGCVYSNLDRLAMAIRFFTKCREVKRIHGQDVTALDRNIAALHAKLLAPLEEAPSDEPSQSSPLARPPAPLSPTVPSADEAEPAELRVLQPMPSFVHTPQTLPPGVDPRQLEFVRRMCGASKVMLREVAVAARAIEGAELRARMALVEHAADATRFALAATSSRVAAEAFVAVTGMHLRSLEAAARTATAAASARVWIEELEEAEQRAAIGAEQRAEARELRAAAIFAVVVTVRDATIDAQAREWHSTVCGFTMLCEALRRAELEAAWCGATRAALSGVAAPMHGGVIEQAEAFARLQLEESAGRAVLGIQGAAIAADLAGLLLRIAMLVMAPEQACRDAVVAAAQGEWAQMCDESLCSLEALSRTALHATGTRQLARCCCAWLSDALEPARREGLMEDACRRTHEIALQHLGVAAEQVSRGGITASERCEWRVLCVRELCEREGAARLGTIVAAQEREGRATMGAALLRALDLFVRCPEAVEWERLAHSEAHARIVVHETAARSSVAADAAASAADLSRRGAALSAEHAEEEAREKGVLQLERAARAGLFVTRCLLTDARRRSAGVIVHLEFVEDVCRAASDAIEQCQRGLLSSEFRSGADALDVVGREARDRANVVVAEEGARAQVAATRRENAHAQQRTALGHQAFTDGPTHIAAAETRERMALVIEPAARSWVWWGQCGAFAALVQRGAALGRWQCVEAVEHDERRGLLHGCAVGALSVLGSRAIAENALALDEMAARVRTLRAEATKRHTAFTTFVRGTGLFVTLGLEQRARDALQEDEGQERCRLRPHFEAGEVDVRVVRLEWREREVVLNAAATAALVLLEELHRGAVHVQRSVDMTGIRFTFCAAAAEMMESAARLAIASDAQREVLAIAADWLACGTLCLFSSVALRKLEVAVHVTAAAHGGAERHWRHALQSRFADAHRVAALRDAEQRSRAAVEDAEAGAAVALRRGAGSVLAAVERGAMALREEAERRLIARHCTGGAAAMAERFGRLLASAEERRAVRWLLTAMESDARAALVREAAAGVLSRLAPAAAEGFLVACGDLAAQLGLCAGHLTEALRAHADIALQEDVARAAAMSEWRREGVLLFVELEEAQTRAALTSGHFAVDVANRRARWWLSLLDFNSSLLRMVVLPEAEAREGLAHACAVALELAHRRTLMRLGLALTPLLTACLTARAAVAHEEQQGQAALSHARAAGLWGGAIRGIWEAVLQSRAAIILWGEGAARSSIMAHSADGAVELAVVAVAQREEIVRCAARREESLEWTSTIGLPGLVLSEAAQRALRFPPSLHAALVDALRSRAALCGEEEAVRGSSMRAALHAAPLTVATALQVAEARARAVVEKKVAQRLFSAVFAALCATHIEALEALARLQRVVRVEGREWALLTSMAASECAELMREYDVTIYPEIARHRSAKHGSLRRLPTVRGAAFPSTSAAAAAHEIAAPSRASRRHLRALEVTHAAAVARLLSFGLRLRANDDDPPPAASAPETRGRKVTLPALLRAAHAPTAAAAPTPAERAAASIAFPCEAAATAAAHQSHLETHERYGRSLVAAAAAAEVRATFGALLLSLFVAAAATEEERTADDIASSCFALCVTL